MKWLKKLLQCFTPKRLDSVRKTNLLMSQVLFTPNDRYFPDEFSK